ncbi:unnamed protein product [Polarella glacialis]|uniref:Uncharacterized protein n=1 Tax=Polarella glacialis TaxID=89957 RepID=A0A813GVW6_POLGL|nr:unnamed protein product [Polarella glacialis]|mmetsp:Transcript_43535/g.78618  ORF Transcript_43535/g.78618 Transcript_43535/m.78618 type:complete len:256 (-) Transcript_43535:181-948(-)
MAAIRRQSRVPRRAALVALVLGAVVSPLSFILPGAVPQEQAAASRRSFLSAAASAVVASSLQAPAFAKKSEGPPKQLEVSGGIQNRKDMNGQFSLVDGKLVNERAVYKKDDKKIYLMFNSCEQFQFADEITPDCTGWGLEKKSKWFMDGKEAYNIKIKPIKPIEAAGEVGAVPVAATQEGPDFGFQLPKFEMPKMALSGKESDDELLNMGDDVNSYIKSKGGGGSNFLTQAMTLSDDEKSASDRLEARLAGKMIR